MKELSMHITTPLMQSFWPASLHHPMAATTSILCVVVCEPFFAGSTLEQTSSAAMDIKGKEEKPLGWLAKREKAASALRVKRGFANATPWDSVTFSYIQPVINQGQEGTEFLEHDVDWVIAPCDDARKVCAIQFWLADSGLFPPLLSCVTGCQLLVNKRVVRGQAPVTLYLVPSFGAASHPMVGCACVCFSNHCCVNTGRKPLW